MRFESNVEVPDPLLSALSRDELVFFIGAGTSGKARPRQRRSTYYPLFPELVMELCKSLHIPLDSAMRSDLRNGFADRVLGRLPADNEVIHNEAAKILTEDENLKTSLSLYKTIIRLAASSPQPRIVTTNFDRLLIRACNDEGFGNHATWKIHIAPALPPGDRFTGLCYLHGLVETPSGMILTDSDIGLAYMDEGWALSFAHRLFTKYCVLFIGYSLQDPPLRYLTLALAGKSGDARKHYALVKRPSPSEIERQANDWKRRGVEPIWYPGGTKDHTALEKTLREWVKDARKSYVDKKEFLQAAAEVDPTLLPPTDKERIKLLLKTPELRRDFAKMALAPQWFELLLEWEHFRLLLERKGDFQEADYHLAENVIRWLFDSPFEMMAKIQNFRNARTLHGSLVTLFFERLDKSEGHIPMKILRILLEFFRHLLEEENHGRFVLLLKKPIRQLLKANYVDDAVWLFMLSIGSSTKVIINKSLSYEMAREAGKNVDFMFPLEAELQPYFRQLDYPDKAREYLLELFFPCIEITAYPLTVALSRELEELRRSLMRSGKAEYVYLRRPAIERHAENMLLDDVQTLLIDFLRDLWEMLLILVDGKKAQEIFRYWKTNNDVIFRKLVLYAANKILEYGIS